MGRFPIWHMGIPSIWGATGISILERLMTSLGGYVPLEITLGGVCDEWIYDIVIYIGMIWYDDIWTDDDRWFVMLNDALNEEIYGYVWFMHSDMMLFYLARIEWRCLLFCFGIFKFGMWNYMNFTPDLIWFGRTYDDKNQIPRHTKITRQNMS